MAVISSLKQLTSAEKLMCDDILTVLIERNHPLDPPALDQVRQGFWDKMFGNNWTTDKPNPSPATLRKRTNDETGLYIGTLNQDVPKNGTVPAHRRAGQPVLLKASFPLGCETVSFFWVDQQGHRDKGLSTASIDIEGALTLDEAKAQVGHHYDANESERVGSWNWEKVIHWGRARLIRLARVRSGGRGFGAIGERRDEGGEDLEELQQLHLVEESNRMDEEEGACCERTAAPPKAKRRMMC
ncbi:hypothetical protein CCHL11_01047 [Colletotrichum chlorophyti]|uniref:Uncharacterized protein n=1 Tax=Colletotrichum chlorophyti TaxID=708187 RepID=A0A1Q8S7U8_9PEZI|nr:hypothetical protein CCHL11_01047 [Colletotrichum chlorophyti]